MAPPISREARWLFIGDSITDCDWRPCPDQLGSGYVRLIRDWLLASLAESAPAIINRGIGGNKVTDLEHRWEKDVVEERPDLVSVKIGINDVWHGLEDPANGVSLERFQSSYAGILRRLKDALPGTTIVLCEPTVIWPPASAVGNERLAPYVQAVKELAQDFGVSALVPLHDAFQKAAKARPDVSWAPDGVHPSSAGHMLIARTWLATLGLL